MINRIECAASIYGGRIRRAAWENTAVPPPPYMAPFPRLDTRHLRPATLQLQKSCRPWIRTVPIVPVNKARIVGLKTGTDQRGIADQKTLKEQHATIPDRRSFSFETDEVFINFRTVNRGKFPRPRTRVMGSGRGMCYEKAPPTAAW